MTKVSNNLKSELEASRIQKHYFVKSIKWEFGASFGSKKDIQLKFFKCATTISQFSPPLALALG